MTAYIYSPKYTLEWGDHVFPGDKYRLVAEQLLKEGITRDFIVPSPEGNGTARIFAGDPSVYTFSIHQEHNYPLKGRSSWDMGLDDFTEDGTYLDLLRSAVPKILDEFKPDISSCIRGETPTKRINWVG